jgi:hypothetical protein
VCALAELARRGGGTERQVRSAMEHTATVLITLKQKSL